MKSIPIRELRKIYSADFLVEVKDKDQAIRDIQSKSSACWGAGQILTGGWIALARPSPRRKGEKPTQFVCRHNLVKDNLPKEEKKKEEYPMGYMQGRGAA